VPLRAILLDAFLAKDYELSGPSWIDSDRFDIEAKLPRGSTKSDASVMMQTLLRERFHLKFHRATTPIPGFEIKVDGSGIKLKESKFKEASSTDAPLPRQMAGLNSPGFREAQHGSVFRISAVRQSIGELARLLERQMNRPVVDSTGLTAEYDFSLLYSIEELSQSDARGADAPFVATVLHNQLGLRLQKTKVERQTVVIDALDRIPTAN
jgi:uncharacterized protein (TIGR03435 family)